MNKLALAFASLAIAATPVLACPHMDGAESAAPKTADKAKDAPKATETKDTAKTAKPVEKAPEKKADKVSQK